MDAIKIYKGDDSDFNSFRDITITLTAEFSLVGCGAEFRLQNYREVIPDISSGTFTITLSSEATRKLRVGETYGRLSIIDAQGRRLTILDELLFEVTKELVTEEISEASFEVTVNNAPVGIDIMYPFRYARQTADTYAVSGYTGITTLDMSDCTFEDLCGLVGRMIETLETAELAGGASGYAARTDDVYAVTGFSELLTLDMSDCTFEDLCNVVGSVIETLKTSGVIQ